MPHAACKITMRGYMPAASKVTMRGSASRCCSIQNDHARIGKYMAAASEITMRGSASTCMVHALAASTLCMATRPVDFSERALKCAKVSRQQNSELTIGRLATYDIAQQLLRLQDAHVVLSMLFPKLGHASFKIHIQERTG